MLDVFLVSTRVQTGSCLSTVKLSLLVSVVFDNIPQPRKEKNVYKKSQPWSDIWDLKPVSVCPFWLQDPWRAAHAPLPGDGRKQVWLDMASPLSPGFQRGEWHGSQPVQVWPVSLTQIPHSVPEGHGSLMFLANMCDVSTRAGLNGKPPGKCWSEGLCKECLWETWSANEEK